MEDNLASLIKNVLEINFRDKGNITIYTYQFSQCIFTADINKNLMKLVGDKS